MWFVGRLVSWKVWLIAWLAGLVWLFLIILVGQSVGRLVDLFWFPLVIVLVGRVVSWL
jgi:hypothetical protein